MRILGRITIQTRKLGIVILLVVLLVVAAVVLVLAHALELLELLRHLVAALELLLLLLGQLQVPQQPDFPVAQHDVPAGRLVHLAAQVRHLRLDLALLLARLHLVRIQVYQDLLLAQLAEELARLRFYRSARRGHDLKDFSPGYLVEFLARFGIRSILSRLVCRKQYEARIFSLGCGEFLPR